MIYFVQNVSWTDLFPQDRQSNVKIALKENNKGPIPGPCEYILILKLTTGILAFYKLPLAACSRSIASNKALKLPLPKLWAPLR